MQAKTNGDELAAIETYGGVISFNLEECWCFDHAYGYRLYSCNYKLHSCGYKLHAYGAGCAHTVAGTSTLSSARRYTRCVALWTPALRTPCCGHAPIVSVVRAVPVHACHHTDTCCDFYCSYYYLIWLQYFTLICIVLAIIAILVAAFVELKANMAAGRAV